MEYAEKIKGYLLRFLEEKKYSSVKRKKIWVFGEWFGKRCNDNCLFLANYIVQNDPSINVYWVACKDADLSLLSDKVKILEYDSTPSLEIFKQAGVVFMNQGYIDFSSTGYNYFRGAVTVNLWHGVAWKKIGYDASKKGGLLHEINTKIYDYFEKTSFYLSLSERYSKVLKSAFHTSDSQIICAGYPRNSYFYSSEWLKENRTKICQIISNETGLCISDKTRIIVYKEDVVCGKVAQSIDELKQAIQSYYIDSNEDAELRNQRKKEFMEFESPNSCKEIVQEILTEK